jgi:predicted nucleic acid binding AN1-type Zn finger protein
MNKSTKCKKCNLKKSIVLECKCKNSYCISHLSPEFHNCESLNLFKKEAYEKNKEKLITKKEKPEWV